MNKRSFESRVLHLWMTTRVPLTPANLAFYSGAPRDKVDRWLDALCASGVLDFDPDDEGELVYRVRGASRPPTGVTQLAEVAKREQLEAKLGDLTRGSLVPARRAARALAKRGTGDKSVVASAALSFFLGPMGWLYAAPLSTAAAGIGGFLLLYWLLPSFLFTPLLALLLPASALAGAYFAWTHKPTS